MVIDRQSRELLHVGRKDFQYNWLPLNSIAKYLSGITYRIDNERKTYQLPADVFIDPQNWNGNTFKYETEVKTTKSIEATGVVGLSIFWKINK